MLLVSPQSRLRKRQADTPRLLFCCALVQLGGLILPRLSTARHHPLPSTITSKVMHSPTPSYCQRASTNFCEPFSE
jgi:hypothetical protein